uniref:Secreted protein n=1 Tax=Arundo donax TaxID=35708 RepID=A0A0A9AXF2_ARUDO
MRFVLVLLLRFCWTSGDLAQDLSVQHLVLLAGLRVRPSSEVVHLVLVLVVQDRHRVQHQDSNVYQGEKVAAASNSRENPEPHNHLRKHVKALEQSQSASQHEEENSV